MMQHSAIAVLATSLLTGCAAAKQGPVATHDSARSVAFPVIADWAEVHRPIDDYLPTADEEVTLAGLSFGVQKTCLASRGYRVSELEPTGYPAFIRGTVRDLVVRSDVHGFFDTDNVDKYGYLRPLTTPGHILLTPPVGVPGDVFRTCQSAGARAVSPADRAGLPGGGPALATADPQIKSAIAAAWADCMADAGYHATDPGAVIGDHQSGSPTDISVARADVSCKRQTNLVGIATGVQAGVDDAYIRANQSALDAYRATVTELVRQALEAR